MMPSSVNVTRCLPDLRRKWLPVDFAAKALFRVMKNGELDEPEKQEMEVYHIVNDDLTVTSTDLLGWKLEDFERVEPRAWVERLEKLEGESKQHPALKLFGHWKKAYEMEIKRRDNAGDSTGPSPMNTTSWSSRAGGCPHLLDERRNPA